jgi:hypothetical protein
MSISQLEALPCLCPKTGKRAITYLDGDGTQLIEEFKPETHQAVVGKEAAEYVKTLHENIIDTNILPNDYATGESKAEIFERMRLFIERHWAADDPRFYSLLAMYSLASHLHELYNHFPVLMIVAASNRGKTVLQKTLYLLLYQPFYGSGSDSVACVRRLLDIGITYIGDEKQGSLSDQNSECHRHITQGTSKGSPIRVNQPGKNGEYKPYAYNCYGPKVYGARYLADDEAILNRCYIVKPGRVDAENYRRLSDPLSEASAKESQSIRNELATYRLERFRGLDDSMSLAEIEAEGFVLNGRDRDLFQPLLREAPSYEVRKTIYELIQEMKEAVKDDMENAIEPTVLISAYKLYKAEEAPPTCKDIAMAAQDWCGSRIAPRTVGKILKAYKVKKRHSRQGVLLDCSLAELGQVLMENDLSIPSIKEVSNNGGKL